MRILATNPDTIGDVVLRQPLYSALQKAGHELLLVTRPLLEPVMSLVAPGAELATVGVDLYDGDLTRGDAALDPVAERAREFAPDMLLVAPYQWTVLEERLALAVPGARQVAMSGRLFADPARGPGLPSILAPATVVDVTEDTPELRKNEKLAGAVLGRSIALPDPQLVLQESHIRAAEAELSRLGIDAGAYWIACVGDTPGTRVRNWGGARWAELLSGWARERGQRFLFIGSGAERETAMEIRAAMGDQGARVAEWFGEGDGALDLLIGLIALSRGYVGRDTGPMHLAAAVGKPVLAVFGGGTWPRFLPAVDPSVSITIGVPCAGCGWLCHLNDSYCIKEVPVAEVARAASGLEDGSVTKRTTRLIRPDPELLARIGREGAVTARKRLVQIGGLRREIHNGGGPAGAALERAVREVSDAGARTGRIQGELAAAHRRLETSRGQIQTLKALAAEHSRARARQAAVASATRDQLIEMQARVAAVEKRLEERVTELLQTRSELATLREQARVREKGEAAHQGQIDNLRAALEKAESALAARQQEAVALKQQLSKMSDELKAARGQEVGTPEGDREAELRRKLAQARAEAASAASGLTDLKLRLARFEADQAALANLSREQETEIVVLRDRLRDLMASRWRKIGQRLGVAMTMPWERGGENGSP